MSMGSICSLYPVVDLSLSCSDPMACNAAPSSGCGVAAGPFARVASAHRAKICIMNPITLGRFSFDRHRHSSTMKFTAAVRGEYISSMMSYPFRTTSFGSVSQSSWSAALWHSCGNAIWNTISSSSGRIILYVFDPVSAVVRYCSARFIILSGRNPPAGKTDSNRTYDSKNAHEQSRLNASANGLCSGLHCFGLPYRWNILFAT
mmetsp:Transcript_8895/g.32581  ORF Transcript_8895/g.32581 Transcript_8895/m.32581 type:complete len:204 (-) Transcript_8895:854-1465(-)